jgi:peroxiredoxin family protein
MEMKEEFILSSFEEVTENIEITIERLEDKSNVHFEYEGLEKVEKEVLNHIKKWSKKNSRDSVAIPDEKREERKEEMKKQVTKTKEYGRSLELYRCMEKARKRVNGSEHDP